MSSLGLRMLAVWLVLQSSGAWAMRSASDCSRSIDELIWAKVEDRFVRSGFKVETERGELFVRQTLDESEGTLEATRSPELACAWSAARIGFDFAKYCLQSKNYFKTFFAQKFFRPLLGLFRHSMTHAGEIFRKYISGIDMDAQALRWDAVEGLFKKGKIQGSFGHAVRQGMVEIQSPIVQAAEAIAKIRTQRKVIGRDMIFKGGKRLQIKKFDVGPMVSVSGMSFPQLSAQSHISLLYMHLKLNKEGVPMMLNTGEGGPRFHMALLKGDVASLKKEVTDWAILTGRFQEGSWDQAKVEVFIEELMLARGKLFEEFSENDLRGARIVAQFGSALNGIRGSDGRIDLLKLKELSEEEGISMFQFKLKQAAKRGAKVDPNKVDEITAAMRELPGKGKEILSPSISSEMQDWNQIAQLVLMSKSLTGKPVSLKMGVGNVEDTFEFLKFLRDAGALPDHLQIDGRGLELSPGSGNAPFAGNTSLPLNEAVMVANALLRKLGVRDQVYLEASGDVLIPAEGVEKLALGADGISAARLWMGMGLGCAKVRQCASGSCPYGIASSSNGVFARALDPKIIGPQGFTAAKHWFDSYTTALGESAVKDWTQYFEEAGIGHPKSQIRKADAKGVVRLETYYDKARVKDLFGDVMSDGDIERFVYSGR